MTARARGAAVALACALCLAGTPQRGATLDALQLSLDELRGPGWRSGPVRAQVRADASGALWLRVQARELQLAAPLQAVRAASLECPAARASGGELVCPDARLMLEMADGEPLGLTAAVSFERAGARLRVRAAEQAVAGGRLALRLELSPAALSLDARFTALHAARLQAAASAATLPVAVSEGTLSGELSVQLTPAAGDVSARLDLAGGVFSDESGLHAGEGVDASLTLQGRRAGAGGWELQAQAALRAGAVFVNPLLLDVPDAPLHARASGRWTPGERLQLVQLELRDPALGMLSATLDLMLAPQPRVAALTLSLAPTAAEPLYRRYLRPFAGAGLLSDLRVAGQVSAQLDWRADSAAWAWLELAHVDVGDAGGRFAVLGLDGRVHWSQGQTARPSRLAWSDLQTRSLAFGGGVLDAELDARGARLLAPVTVPLLDGSVRLQRLQGHDLGLESQRVEADLALTPVSLQRLSERLAWLPLAGSIAGEIPHLVYARGRLAVQGDIRMQLFGGGATVSGLELEDPFGVVPRLRASLRVQDIDLAVLTRAMSFGSIEGRLEGRVDGLVLEGWQPVAFDAQLRTPEDDDSRHRISQRAVDNLASLGGANAVLSSTFLRFFKEFSYERLGLSCRLRAGVCQMGGVGRADRGYYIVKGGGMPPRVNVIGFNERVDWPTLLDRLRAVASSPGPVVR